MPEPMTPERLAELDARCYVPSCADEDHMVVRELVAEVRRLTPRQITTVEELEALPVDAVLAAADGHAVRRGRSGAFWRTGMDLPFSPEVTLRAAPLLLIHVPPLDGAR